MCLVSRFFRSLISLSLASTLLLPLSAQRRKKEEDRTQQLEVLPDPPLAVVVDTSRVSFLVSPLSSKGLLTQQTRDALKAIGKASRGGQIVRIRAFVAGNGEVRRIQTIVSEELGDKKNELPSLTLVQVGQLGLVGAQVQLEATILEKKPRNPHGLAFFSGQYVAAEGAVENPLGPVLPLAEKSLRNLATAASASGVASGDMMRVTCLVSSLADYSAVQSHAVRAFPGAALAVVQLRRGPSRSEVECEGVGRLPRTPAQPVSRLNPPGLPSSPNYSQVTLVNTPRLILTGEQLGFGSQDADVRLAFERLGKTLESKNASYQDVFFTSYYPVAGHVQEKLRAVRGEFLAKERPPSSTNILFEGLRSVDASFAIDVIAASN